MPVTCAHGYSMPGGCITGVMAQENAAPPVGQRPPRFGITVPFDGVRLEDHRSWYAELIAARVHRRVVSGDRRRGRLHPTGAGRGLVTLPPAGCRHHPRLHQGAGTVGPERGGDGGGRPGRFTLGLGTSSDVIVSRWNGIEFAEPYRRVRDTIRFLRSALAGEKVDHAYETFTVRGFRLARPVEDPPPIFLAALRPGMLRLAGREADGVILNWLSAEDVATVTPELGADIPVAARIFVCPTEDTDTARAVGRRMIAAYLNVGVYEAFHRWLGRGPLLEPMWTAWQAGDRKGALAAIPDEVVDSLVVHGSFEQCRAHVGRYMAHGVDIPVMAVIPLGVTIEAAVKGLAPPWTAP